jgi:predicted aminopeptidase
MLFRMSRPWLALALAAPLLGGCVELCYLGQAAAGQEDIGHRARPLEEAIADERVPAKTRAMLALIEDVKHFGERHGLTATESYREYADLERSAVVWVVTASHPLRFEPVTWRFPIVGAVPYLGWFERADAIQQAQALSRDGNDVYVREARAYSTLGWFRDPVLSTMLKDGPDDVIEVVLHESMHATHYVPSQTIFNESLANFVGSHLATAYLKERLRADAWRLFDHEARAAEHERRVERLEAAHATLSALYASNLEDAEKLDKKHTILTALQRELGALHPLNNAALLQAQAYDSGASGFAALLSACGASWPRFVREVRTIGQDDFTGPDQAALDALLEARARAGCPPR